MAVARSKPFIPVVQVRPPIDERKLTAHIQRPNLAGRTDSRLLSRTHIVFGL